MGVSAMPFDGTTYAPDPTPEQRVLLGALRFFEADDNWVQCVWGDSDGRRCLMGAMNATRRKLGIKGDKSSFYLKRAIMEHHRYGRLDDFNDRTCSGIDELCHTIWAAYLLATSYHPRRLPSIDLRRSGYSESSLPFTISWIPSRQFEFAC
jgi:hypothetical protein